MKYFLLLVLFFVPLVSAVEIFLESSEYACSANITNCANGNDNDYNTLITLPNGEDSYVYENYSTGLITEIVHIQFESDYHPSGDGGNLTVPSACLNAQDSKTQFRWYGYSEFESSSYMACWNGATWVNIFTPHQVATFADSELMVRYTDYASIYLVDNLETITNSLTATENVTSNTYNRNPIILYKPDFSQNSDLNLCAVVDGYTSACSTFSFNYQTNNYTLDMFPSVLNITFTGNTPSDYVITDSSGIVYVGENQNNISYNLSDFVENSKVAVHFNPTSDDSFNFTQRYEFINHKGQDIVETLNIVNTNFLRDDLFIRVLTASNNPLSNALVRVSQLNVTSSPQNFSLNNQLLTDDNGYAQVKTLNGLSAKINVSKDGYNSLVYTLHFSFLQSIGLSPVLPLEFKLGVSSSEDTSLPIFWPPQFISIDKNILGYSIFNPEDTLTYRTSYADSQSRGFSVATTNVYSESGFQVVDGAHTMTLVPGVDFDETATDDIVISHYLNDVFVSNDTITYFDINATDALDISSQNLSGNVLNPILFIVLVLFTIVLQFTFRSESNQVGLHVFMIGSIIISLISITFWPVSLVACLYYLLTMVKQFIGVSV